MAAKAFALYRAVNCRIKALDCTACICYNLIRPNIDEHGRKYCFFLGLH